MESLLHNVEIAMQTCAMASTAVATGEKSPWVDMSDCDGCLFMLIGTSLLGADTITARILGSSISSSTAAGKAHVYAGDAISSSTGYGDAASSYFNHKILMVDVLKPPYRYNRMVITGATGVAASSGKVGWRFINIKHHMRHKGSTTLWDSTSIGTGCSTVWASPAT